LIAKRQSTDRHTFVEKQQQRRTPMRSFIILICAILASACAGIVGPDLETNPTGQPVNLMITVDLTITGDGPISAGGYVDFITPDGDDQFRWPCQMPGGQHFCRATWSPKPVWHVGDQLRVTAVKLDWFGLFRNGIVLNATKRIALGEYRSPVAETKYGRAFFVMSATRR
jgi:hypothetical protein